MKMATESPPSTEDYIAASALAYGQASGKSALKSLLNAAVSYDTALETWTPLLISSPVYAPDGMYADAYLTGAGDVVIAFEGTNNVETQLLNADVSIFDLMTPKAFLDAEAFSAMVAKAAAALGVAPSDIFVTGHSLGASEAEYVSSQLGYGGATFAGTGIPGYADSGTEPDLIDYVDRGDPIANYGSDTQQAEPGFAPVSDMDHVGEIAYKGSTADGYALALSTELTNLGLEYGSSKLFALGLGGLALLVSDHLLGHYASDFSPPLPVPPGSAPTNPNYIIEAVEQLLGAKSQSIISSTTGKALDYADVFPAFRDYPVLAKLTCLDP